jgi:hypothetical protein
MGIKSLTALTRPDQAIAATLSKASAIQDHHRLCVPRILLDSRQPARTRARSTRLQADAIGKRSPDRAARGSTGKPVEPRLDVRETGAITAARRREPESPTNAGDGQRNEVAALPSGSLSSNICDNPRYSFQRRAYQRVRSRASSTVTMGSVLTSIHSKVAPEVSRAKARTHHTC